MGVWYGVVGALLLVILVLAGKLHGLRTNLKEISQRFSERLETDTNTLIDLSGRDKQMRAFAAQINTQLRLLRAERRRYQQGDQELKEAVTNISHDLRTPLTAIRGYLDLLEREDMSEPARRYLAQIQGRAAAMTSLTEELLRYSIVSSNQELKREPTDLVRVLEESVLSFYGLLQEKGIQPELHLPEEPVWRKLDADALSRVYGNILSNAVKYAQGAITVAMTADGRVTVSNQAPGLTAVAVGRLFDRFYTVESSRNSTGLGLSIAKLLTERMGGSITASLEENWLHISVVFPSEGPDGEAAP